MNGSVRPSVCLSVTPFWLWSHHCIVISSWNCQELLQVTEVGFMQKVKIRGQRSRSQRSNPNFAVSGPYLQFEFTYDDKMMQKACCSLGEVPYCLSRSTIKFQGHTAKKIGYLHTITPVWIHQWLRNDTQTWCSIAEGPIVFKKSSVKF